MIPSYELLSFNDNLFCRSSNNHNVKGNQFNKTVQEDAGNKTVESIPNVNDNLQAKKNNPEPKQKNEKRIDDRTKEVERKIFLGSSEERMENSNTFGFPNLQDLALLLEDQE